MPIALFVVGDSSITNGAEHGRIDPWRVARWNDMRIAGGATIDSVSRRGSTMKRRHSSLLPPPRRSPIDHSGDFRRWSTHQTQRSEHARPRPSAICRNDHRRPIRDAGVIRTLMLQALLWGRRYGALSRWRDGYPSYTAFARYAAGKAALRSWSLPGADSAFAASVNADSLYDDAAVALAEVRFVGNDHRTGRWRSSPGIASAERARLVRARAHATALLALVEDEIRCLHTV